MGMFNMFSGGAVKETLEGVGTLAKDIRQAITGQDPELERKLAELEGQAMTAQALINVEEAKHPSVFVSGWRPGLGWVCVLGIGYQMVFRPFIELILIHWNVQAPSLDISDLIGLTLAMLGVAGYRTVEKVKDVARN